MFMSSSTSTLPCFLYCAAVSVSNRWLCWIDLSRLASSASASPTLRLRRHCFWVAAEDCSRQNHVEAMPSITLLSASECFLRLPWGSGRGCPPLLRAGVSLTCGLAYRSSALKDAKLSNVMPVTYFRNEFSIAPSVRALRNLNNGIVLAQTGHSTGTCTATLCVIEL